MSAKYEHMWMFNDLYELLRDYTGSSAVTMQGDTLFITFDDKSGQEIVTVWYEEDRPVKLMVNAMCPVLLDHALRYWASAHDAVAEECFPDRPGHA